MSSPPFILIFGRRGVGKTYLASRLVSSRPIGWVWVFNPSRDPQLDGYPVFTLDRAPPVRRTTLVIDDFGLFVEPWTWNNPRHKWVKEAVLLSRHNNTTLICCVHRASDIPRGMRALVTDVYLGTVTDSADLDRLASDFGEACYQARELPAREFLHLKVG